MCVCQLPLTSKVCALNNMALWKVLHFFSNTRFQDNVITDIDNYLANTVRSLFMLYKSTTRDGIFLSRSHGGISVKLFSSVYYCTRVSFTVKMLNHDVENFRNITRSSLDLDMRKRVFLNQMKIIISSVMKLMMKVFLYSEQGSDVKQNG